MAANNSLDSKDLHATRNLTSRNRKIFYGWWVIVGLFGVGMVSPIGRYSLTAFFPSISSEIGWSRSVVGSAQTLSVVLYALMVPFTGWLIDRIGTRKTLFIGGLVNLGGWILISVIKSLWQLYLFYSMTMAVAVSMGHYVPIQATARKWFMKRAGLVSGILIAAFAVGTAIFIPLLTAMDGTFGWRKTCVIFGFAFGVLILLLATFVIRDTPESMGLAPDGGTPVEISPRGQIIGRGDWSVKEALKTSQYWLLFSTFSFQGMPINGLLAHLVIWGVDLGSTKEAAGIFITALTLGMAIAAPIGGWVGDTFGKKRTIIASNLCSLFVMLLAWERIHTPHQLIVFAIAIGFTLNLQIGVYGPYLGDFFGRANIGSLYGILTAGWGLIGGTGAFLWGLIFDITSNYNFACLLSVACYGVACVTAVLIQTISGNRPLEKS